MRWGYSQYLMDDRLLFSFSGRTQTSFGQAMAASEQIGLGGPDGLSAYDSGTLQGDSGVVSRAELAFPLTLPPLDDKIVFASAFTPYVFASGGSAVLHEPMASETRISRAGALCLGFRAALGQTAGPGAASVSLEYAHGSDSDGGQDDRFNLRFVGAF